MNTIFSALGIFTCLIIVLLAWNTHQATRTQFEHVRNRRREGEHQLRTAAALLEAWVESHPDQREISSRTREVLADITGILAEADDELC